jgi:hypothetical protein
MPRFSSHKWSRVRALGEGGRSKRIVYKLEFKVMSPSHTPLTRQTRFNSTYAGHMHRESSM